MSVLRYPMVLALIASACGPAKTDVSLQVVQQSCAVGVSSLERVALLEVNLFDSTGKLRSSTTVPSARAVAQKVTLQVAHGAGYLVEVNGFDKSPSAGGTLVATGRSAPFSTLDGTGDLVSHVAVNVFLRTKGSLTPVVSAASPTACDPPLTMPRAGHTASTLVDGRLFISGGFDTLQSRLSSTETYDPASGTFTATHALTLSIGSNPVRMPRAEHSSTRLPSGQLLLWGGDVSPTQPSSVQLVYDSVLDEVGVLPNGALARSHHGAAADLSGLVLIAGGLTKDTLGELVPAQAVEWFDPTTNHTQMVAGVSLPRDGASVIAVENGALIAVAGGTDGTTLPREVKLFAFDGTQFGNAPVTVNPWLTVGRRNAAAATVLNGTRLLLAGGHSDPSLVSPMGSSDIVDPVIGQSSPGPEISPRGEACAVTLDDHHVLLAGGQELDPNGVERGSSIVELVTFADDGTATVGALPSLPVGRFKHSCTLLDDGTVLIAGGVSDQGGVETVLQDAYVFQP